LAAEAEARNKKRKAEGKPLLEEDVRRAAAIEAPKEGTPAVEDDEANKRRKLLQEALEMDKDDDDDDDEEEKNDNDDDESERIPKRKTIPLSFCVNSRKLNAKGQKKSQNKKPSKMLSRPQTTRHISQLPTRC